MVLYVAIVAILNLGLGYGLAVYLGKGGTAERESQPADYESDYDYDYADGSDDSYESGYESEVETTASV